MMLHRVMKQVRAQNWSAVFLDLLIVVLGIFLGLQAQDWVDERSDRKLERVYLERLLSDINLSIETTTDVRSFLIGYSEGQQLVVDSLRRCHLPDEKKDAFADGISDLGKVGPSVFVLSTMEEMLSAGHFSLLQNPDVRDILNGLKRDAQYQAEIRLALYSYIETMATMTTRKVTRIYQGYRGPFEPVGWDELDINFEALCQDQEFQAGVSHVRAMTDNMRSLNERALAKLGPAKTALEAELGISPRLIGGPN